MRYENNDLFSENELKLFNEELKKNEKFDLPASLDTENVVGKLKEISAREKKAAVRRFRAIGIAAACAAIAAGSVFGLVIAFNRSGKTPEISSDNAAETTAELPAQTSPQDGIELPAGDQDDKDKNKDNNKDDNSETDDRAATADADETKKNDGGDRTLSNDTPSGANSGGGDVNRSGNNGGSENRNSGGSSENSGGNDRRKPDTGKKPAPAPSPVVPDPSVTDPDPTPAPPVVDPDPPAPTPPGPVPDPPSPTPPEPDPPVPQRATVFDHNGMDAGYNGSAERAELSFEQIDETSTKDLLYYDVKEDQWYSDSVEFCVLNGYMINTDEKNFNPDEVLTRAETARIVSVMCSADVASEDAPAPRYADVSNTSKYVNTINWIASNGIMYGVSAEEFYPESAVTREQLCTVLLSLSDHLGLDTEIEGDISGFTDLGDTDPWAKAGIEYSVGAGLISGTDENTFSPKASVSRAQMAVIIKNYMTEVYSAGHTHEWAEATCTEPSYCTKCHLKKGSALGHLFRENICTDNGKCIRCGNVVPAAGHEFKAIEKQATCTEPGGTYRECLRCGLVESVKPTSPLGHTTYNGMCARCGRYITKTDDIYGRLKSYLQSEAETDCGGTGRCCGEEFCYENGSVGSAYIFYDEDLDGIMCEYKYTPAGCDFSIYTGFVIRQGTKEVEVYGFRSDGERYVGVSGTLLPSCYSVGRYAYDSIDLCTDGNYLFTVCSDMNELFPEMIRRLDDVLKSGPEMTIAQIGFMIY